MRSSHHLLFVILLAPLTACVDHTESGSGEDAVGTIGGAYRNLDPAVDYVGIDACKECHPVQFQTYVESQMGRSFKPATRQASAATFEEVEPVYDPYKDFYYLPFARGDSLYLTEFRLTGNDTVYSRTEKIDYIVGSGQHTNSHMMEVNGYLYQIPLTWYAQEGRWDLPPGFDEGHSWRFDRAVEVECMTCHNAMPEYVEGSDNRFTELPHGINCERCHGPGAVHVAEKKAGEIVITSEAIDWTIVNPAKLSPELQFDVCQRCHLQGVAVPREGYSFVDYRPGMRLGDVINVYFPRYTDSLSQFIMASHPDRLRMSACRVPSPTVEGQLDPLPCITCHDPHVPVEAIGRAAYNEPCLGCHGPSNVQRPTSNVSNTQCTEDPAARAAGSDDCSACHMPFVESMDIPHVRITDHNIRVPQPTSDGGENEQEDSEKRFVRLASLTDAQPTHEMMGEGYLTYYEQFNNVPQFLDSAAVTLERARASQSDRSIARALIRLWYLQEDYSEIVSLADGTDLSGLTDPWTHYRIGEAYSNLGRRAEARASFQTAVDLGPDHLWFRTKLASAYVALQLPDQAVTILNGVIKDNPKFANAYNNRGFAHLLAGNFVEAESDFRANLALDPDAKQALANLASLYFNAGEPASARPLIERLIKLEPGNEQYRQFRDAVDAAL